MKVKSDRLLSINILCQLFLHNGSLSTLLSKATSSAKEPNSALIQEFCYGVCRHYYQLEYISSSLLQKPLRKKDTDIKCLILLGLYQLFFMRTPPHAAVNETVRMVQELNKSWAKGLVNAVLREAQRQHPSLQKKIDANYCYKYSHPDWLISALKQSWPEHYQEILHANNNRAPMALRLNLSRCSRKNYLTTLSESGISAQAGALCSTAVILNQPVPVLQLPGFDTGLVSIQDEASQLCSTLLAVEPGQRVLDACAAPGGKTCALLEQQSKLKELVAVDYEQWRLDKVQENLNRTGLSATLHNADINSTKDWWDGVQFDRILLDVPCSATGVIRRHPDIKILRRAKDIIELVGKQQTILNTAWPLLKPGGMLLYSTCSLLLEENSQQINSFITHNENARHIPINAQWGLSCEFGRQLLPGMANQDGFYFALLRKQ